MKILSKLFALAILLSAISVWASFGEFGDGTSPSDTVYMEFSTWDSSGHGADADSVCWLRFYHGTLIDSTLSTDATYKVQTGLYVLPKRAFDGTNYGQYTVYFWFNYTDKDKRVYQSNSYLVRDGNVGKFPKNIEDVKANLDTVKREQRDSTFGAISDINKANFKADVSNLLSIADSSLYMRTDWGNVKNQDAMVELKHTRIAFVDTTDIVVKTLSASVDTSQIKAMNQNNQWGASFVWNYPDRTLTSGSGSGINGVVVRCKSLSDSSSIALAQIQVLDSTQSSTIALLTSDSQGRGFFALDNGVYCVRLFKPGWQFSTPETLKVDGDEDTTYYADRFDPGSPPQASLCRVYGWVHDIKDQPVVGAKVIASVQMVPLRYQNIIISPYYKSAETDDEGYWYMDLYPNSVLNPSDTEYIFHIFSPSGTILRQETEVPDQSSWQLQW